MIVTRSSRHGVIVVRPSGRLGLGPSLDELRETLEAIHEDDTGDNLVLELSDVTFLDSATLGEIMAARRRAVLRGGALIVAGLSGKVADLFSLTHMDRFLDVRPDLESALAALRDGSDDEPGS